jgi:tRNA A37 threonylcarbamoyladenosine dehydratase
MNQRLNRFELLIGKDKVKSLQSKVVLICGLGGVGGTCLESLARSGVETFIIVDYDVVDVTNLNRQVLFDSSDVGSLKVDSALKR